MPRVLFFVFVFSVTVPLHETEITYIFIKTEMDRVHWIESLLVIYTCKAVSQQNKSTVGQLGSTGLCFVLDQQLS